MKKQRKHYTSEEKVSILRRQLGEGKGSAGSLEDLGPPPGAGLIDGDLANGRRFNYTITLSPGPSDTGRYTSKYTLTAQPQSYGSYSRRRFFTDDSGGIRYTARRTTLQRAKIVCSRGSRSRSAINAPCPRMVVPG